MPYLIEWKHKGAYVYFWGPFDVEVNSRAFRELVHSPHIDSINHIFWDLSAITEHLASEEETILTAIHTPPAHRPAPLKMAVYVQDETTRRLKRRYTAFYGENLPGWDYLVSNDLAAIKAWLGVEEDGVLNTSPAKP